MIFLPSAAQFQYRWFETQWQHFVIQFEKSGETDFSALSIAYENSSNRSMTPFHRPEFICFRDSDGTEIRFGVQETQGTDFDLARAPLWHIGLTFAIINGGGPDHVMVFDSRRDSSFKASWSTELIRDELQSFALRILALTLIIALLIIAPLYLFLRQKFVKPLTQITARIEEFAADPTIIMEPVETSDSVGEIHEIAKAFTSLTEDVRRALRHKERLADIGEATAKINHDLRNILVSATLVTDRLSASDDPKIKRIAPHIERAISDAASMTQNMMDYLTEAKTENRMIFLLTEMADNLAHDTKLEIAIQGADTINGMPNTLYRLLLNLARNAKSAGASAMTIDIWRAGHLGVIDISDNGPGIDKMLKPHLFSAFYSGHKSNTGLGLAIAKDLALAMGGDLRLSRTSEHGSEFRLSVPVDWINQSG
ncbi:MAG: sensor histidine kinase [Candidatus Puniceispirillaceae bacterium]